MAVSYKEITYLNYGRCLELTNEFARVVVTLDVGPRVIHYSLPGGENVFHTDIDRKITESGQAFDDTYYPGAAWYIYGGHRLWISPEYLPDTYYPDNDRVEYVAGTDSVTFIPPRQMYNNLQEKTAVTLDSGSSRVTIEHFITNCGDKDKTFAPWAISVMRPGGIEIVPQPDRDTGFLGNRVLALWPYTDMSDPRVYWGKRYITLKQDKNATIPFKFGISGEKQWALYILPDVAFIKRFCHNRDGVYPDFGVSYETYTNPHFLEMETLGELTATPPGQTILHVENWELVTGLPTPSANDEDEIDRIVSM